MCSGCIARIPRISSEVLGLEGDGEGMTSEISAEITIDGDGWRGGATGLRKGVEGVDGSS